MPRAAMSEDLDLESDWSLLRQRQSGTMPRVALPPPVDFTAPRKACVESWVRRLSLGDRPLITVKAGQYGEFASVFNHIQECGRGLPGPLATSIARSGWTAAGSLQTEFTLSMGALLNTWHWFTQLLGAMVSPMSVNESLMGIIDAGFNSTLTSMWNALWDLSFKVREQRSDATESRDAVLRWMSGSPLTNREWDLLSAMRVDRETWTTRERLDLCFFLLTLATQNGVFENVVMCLPGIEAGLQLPRDRRTQFALNLGELIQVAEHWGQMESGVGIVLGLDATEANLEAFDTLLPSVSHKLRDSLV